MIILIYGHKGWIGQQIIHYLNKINSCGNFKYICGEARVNNVKQVETEIKSIYPTHVISLIGRTQGDGIQTIDYLEKIRTSFLREVIQILFVNQNIF